MEYRQPPAQDFDGDDAQDWRPKDGHGPLEGVVSERKLVNTKFGECELLTVTDSAGARWRVWGSATTLAACIDEFGPRAGDRIGIRLAGSRPTKNGRNIDLYEMAVEHAPAASGYRQPAAANTGPAPAPVGPASDDEPF